MKESTHEITVGCLTVIFIVVAIVGVFATVFMFYGAIFGAIAAGAYWAFKLIMGMLA